MCSHLSVFQPMKTSILSTNLPRFLLLENQQVTRAAWQVVSYSKKGVKMFKDIISAKSPSIIWRY